MLVNIVLFNVTGERDSVVVSALDLQSGGTVLGSIPGSASRQTTLHARGSPHQACILLGSAH